MQIKQQLLKETMYKYKCPYSMTPQYVTFHNTDNVASAKNEIINMTKESNKKETSFHVAVDDDEAIQGIPFNRNAWASGDGNGTGNRKSIHVEICKNRLGSRSNAFKKAEANAVEVCAQLLKQFNLGIDRLKPHKHWSGKNCPSTTNHQDFINRVRAELDKSNNKSVQSKYNLQAKIKVDKLHVRDSIPKDGKLGNGIATWDKGNVIDIGDIKDNWGSVLLNEKEGYVNMDEVGICKDNIPSKHRPWHNGDYMEIRMKVTVDTLNIRRDMPNPAPNPVIGTLKKHDVIKVFSCRDNWFKVYVPGTTNIGYISGDYIELL